MNLFRGVVGPSDGGAGFVGAFDLPLGNRWSSLAAGTSVTLGIRPEDILVGGPSTEDGIAGTIDLVEAIGAESYISVSIAPGVNGIFRAMGKARFTEGEGVVLRFPRESIHIFDAQGVHVDPVD
jgi:ABC-type sugar transport system ATPase subunit